MNRLVTTLLFTLIIVFVNAQKPNTIYVNLKENKAYKEIPIDKNGNIEIKDSLNGTLLITYPDADFLNYKIKFNEGKDVFILGFNCEGDSCIKIQLSDIANNQLKLTFINNQLTGIGERRINAKLVTGKSNPTVKIISDKAEKPKDMYDDLKVDETKSVQKTPAAREVGEESSKFFCGDVNCKDCSIKDSNSVNKKSYDFYKKIFEERNIFFDKATGNKVTAKYWIVYDNRDGKTMIPYYFKFHNGKDKDKFLETKASLAPKARKQSVITIIGPADSVYIVDGKQANSFEEDLAKVSETVSSFATTKTATSTGGESEEVAKLKTEEEKKKAVLADTEIGDKFMKLRDSTGLNLSNSLINEMAKDPTLQKEVEKIINQYLEAQDRIKTLTRENRRLKEQISGLKSETAKMRKTIDSLNAVVKAKDDIIKALNDTVTVYKNRVDSLIKVVSSFPLVMNLTEKLMSLEKDLEKFNFQYFDISFNEAQYKLDLLCLQLKIKEILNVPAPANAKDLAQYLINLAKSSDQSKQYYVYFANLIKQIEINYKDALSKKPTYKLHSVSKKVPNADDYMLQFKTSKSSNYFFADTFMVSGGLKIDVSTGIFLNGQANNIYVLAPHPFQYKGRADTVIISSGQIDTIFTGKIHDTTGYLIQKNKPKLSYSAGLLVHVYPRTGLPVNIGFATGITISNSNSSPIQMLAGVSLMFKALGSRVSITGGIVYGPIKTISTVAEKYVWNETNDPDNRLYESRNDLPSFYTGSSDIPTYDRWNHSWFVGVTYNFASTSVGKK
jgi:hypothetical protein